MLCVNWKSCNHTLKWTLKLSCTMFYPILTSDKWTTQCFALFNPISCRPSSSGVETHIGQKSAGQKRWMIFSDCDKAFNNDDCCAGGENTMVMMLMITELLTMLFWRAPHLRNIQCVPPTFGKLPTFHLKWNNFNWKISTV